MTSSQILESAYRIKPTHDSYLVLVPSSMLPRPWFLDTPRSKLGLPWAVFLPTDLVSVVGLVLAEQVSHGPCGQCLGSNRPVALAALCCVALLNLSVPSCKGLRAAVNRITNGYSCHHDLPDCKLVTHTPCWAELGTPDLRELIQQEQIDPGRCSTFVSHTCSRTLIA